MCHKVLTLIARYMGPTWGPPGSCRPQMGPMLAPCTLLSGTTPSCPKLHPGRLDRIKTLKCAVCYIAWYGKPWSVIIFQHKTAMLSMIFKQFKIQLSCCSFCAAISYNWTTLYPEFMVQHLFWWKKWQMAVWFYRHTSGIWTHDLPILYLLYC